MLARDCDNHHHKIALFVCHDSQSMAALEADIESPDTFNLKERSRCRFAADKAAVNGSHN